jgi:hypothetical protein
VGIATLILITLLPASFAINPNMEISKIAEQVNALSFKVEQINKSSLSEHDAKIAKKIQLDI